MPSALQRCVKRGAGAAPPPVAGAPQVRVSMSNLAGRRAGFSGSGLAKRGVIQRWASNLTGRQAGLGDRGQAGSLSARF